MDMGETDMRTPDDYQNTYEPLRSICEYFEIESIPSPLSDRQTEVLKMRFGIGEEAKSNEEIAMAYNVPKGRVARIVNEALAELGFEKYYVCDEMRDPIEAILFSDRYPDPRTDNDAALSLWSKMPYIRIAPLWCDEFEYQEDDGPWIQCGSFGDTVYEAAKMIYERNTIHEQ